MCFYSTYENQTLSFRKTRPGASATSASSLLDFSLLRFSATSQRTFPAAHAKMPSWNASSTAAPTVYLGGVESAPSTHAETSEPTLDIVERSASAVARRSAGAVLLAIQAPSAGAMQYEPGTRRKSER